MGMYSAAATINLKAVALGRYFSDVAFPRECRAVLQGKNWLLYHIIVV